MVAEVRLVQPAAIVGHEVPHPSVGVRRVLQERKRAVHRRCPDLLVRATGEFERDDRQTRDVIDAIAAFAVWDDAVCVLQDADVVNECEEVIGADADDSRIATREWPAPPRRCLNCLAQNTRGRARH